VRDVGDHAAASRGVLQQQESPMSTSTTRPRPAISGVHDRAQNRPFASFAEQLLAVRAAAETPLNVDPRLYRLNEVFAAATGASETIPSDGGFLVQQDFSSAIFDRYNAGALISRVTRIDIGPNSNGIKLDTIDETSRATGSRQGGVQSFWINEADTVTAKKPTFRRVNMELEKLVALWYSTNELATDAAAAVDAIAIPSVARELTFMVEDAIINGTGAGQPLGLLNCGALITQPSSGGGASTIKTADVFGMLSRIFPGSIALATTVWLVNPTTFPQLYALAASAPGTLSPATDAAPFGRLCGMPIVPVEQCAALGTIGDIILADLSAYALIEKGGPQTTQSIHVRFINSESVFRFTYRVDGQPQYASPITQYKGGSTMSPFIAFTSTRT
jgi:HK97 family phage major capsid protein